MLELTFFFNDTCFNNKLKIDSIILIFMMNNCANNHRAIIIYNVLFCIKSLIYT